ncbi:MAG: hypothetical protein LW845_15015 [Flammeovirgaceae bacterium]|jgi:hypothetical protein|nr:hypothetical protein [Flammeovirgaceae bacterium]
MIETQNFLATKCDIHVVVCRFFECALGAFKGMARWVCEAPAGSLCSRAAQKYGIQRIKYMTSGRLTLNYMSQSVLQPLDCARNVWAALLFER